MLFVIPTAGEVPIVQAMVAKSFQARELFVVIAGVVMMGVLAGDVAIALRY